MAVRKVLFSKDDLQIFLTKNFLDSLFFICIINKNDLYLQTTILFKDAEEETLLTYSDEIENRIIKAIEEHQKGETIEITPETLWTI